MSVTKDKKETYAVFAGDLVASHLDSLVRFYEFDHQRSIVKVVTAELREIMHKGGATFIQYGEYGEREAELPQDARVIINPLRDYSDVARFLGNDRDAVGSNRSRRPGPKAATGPEAGSS